MKIIYVESKKFGTQECLVDDADYEWLNSFKWFVSKSNNRNKFYIRRKTGGNKSITIHRQILGLTDPKLQGDHKDRNTQNNQRDNLRIATHQQNQCNRSKVKNTSSKYIGVSWSSVKNRWVSLIKTKGKQIYLGVFKNEEDAALAYDRKAKELFGEFANLNFLDTTTTSVA